MNVEIVGYAGCLCCCRKVDVVLEVINNSKADLILFPGSSLCELDDLKYVLSKCTNNHSVIVIEVSDLKKMVDTKGGKSQKGGYPGELYIIDLSKDLSQLPPYANQKYATRAELDRDTELFDKMYAEWKSGLRTFECCGKKVGVLICGETALLRCEMVDNKVQPATFRLSGDKDREDAYNAILSNTDIFLNPIHTVQGMQGKMKERRAVLSGDGRYYFSTAALKGDCDGQKVEAENSKVDLDHYNSLQYAEHNAKELQPANITEKADYITRLYEI